MATAFLAGATFYSGMSRTVDWDFGFFGFLCFEPVDLTSFSGGHVGNTGAWSDILICFVSLIRDFFVWFFLFAWILVLVTEFDM